MNRIVVWFSCGAPSASAAYLALKEFGSRYPVQVCYCDVSVDEHSDNRRFAEDVERWLGVKIRRLHSTEFVSVDDVIEKTRYFAGIDGARCTTELKKKPRQEYQEPGDLHIWGYTVEEFKRIVRFKVQNPETKSYFILAGQGMTRDDCKRMVTDAGIALPVMYDLGFNNNNCIGCGKAKSVAYWQRVRHFFPVKFKQRCEQSRAIGWKPLEIRRKRLYLDQLPPAPMGLLPVITEDISCGPVCGVQE